jgi:hypothetical protein
VWITDTAVFFTGLTYVYFGAYNDSGSGVERPRIQRSTTSPASGPTLTIDKSV